MSSLINRENYEAFYLDYLEGNLNEEQRLAFLSFLKQHPEFKIDEELIFLSEENDQPLDSSFLSSLKVFDHTESITPANCESFMIADIEGILPLTKKIELKDFLANHPELQVDYKLFQYTRLKADSSIIFEEKSRLKKGIIIPIYIKFAAVAASILLALLFIPFDQQQSQNTFGMAGEQPVEDSLQNADHSEEIDSIHQKNINKVNPFTNRKTEKKNYRQELSQQSPVLIAELQPKRITEISLGKIEKTLESLSFNTATSLVKQHTSDAHYLAFEEMKNPVPIITTEINNRTADHTVDFRAAKATKNKQGGFYLKIGNVEISRKVAPVNDIASN